MQTEKLSITQQINPTAKPLYFAPINRFGNYLFRHILLKNGADFVFSELILAEKLDKEVENDKFRLIKEDLDKTIFQIGVGSEEEIRLIIKKLTTDLVLLEMNKEADKKSDTKIRQNNDSENYIIQTKISSTKLKIKEINLNMGCPQSTMQRKEICSGLLYNKEKIRSLSKSFVDECEKYDIIPSAKLRLGTRPDSIEIDDYLKALQDAGIKKVYIHARTLKHPYSRPANYEPLKNIKKDFPDMEIIMNGDIDSYNCYENLTMKLECDGVMIGRTALANPLIFNQIKNKIMPRKYFNGFKPHLNDPNIIRADKSCYLTKEKKEHIIDFLRLSASYGLRFNLVKYNLTELIKGITGTKPVLKMINSTHSVEKTIAEIERLEER